MNDESADLHELKRRVAEKATTDQSFRTEVMASPRAAIRREFGVELPNEIDVKVVEETLTTIWLVLPARPLRGDGVELSDSELGKVAGGKGIIQNFRV